jgi:hypothetical protein
MSPKQESWNKGGYGKLGNGRFPTPNWRPFLNTSPFNTPIEPTAIPKSNSQAIIQRLVGGANPSYFVAGEPTRDFGVAIYYPDQDDPQYKIHCVEPWGTSEIENNLIRLPQGATPSGVWPYKSDFDSHLTVVDQFGEGENAHMQYDLWNILSITPGNPGSIVCKWGGKTRTDGDGLGSDAVAAQFATLAGAIRADEFKVGRIPHALTLTVPCTDGYTWPATKGAWECSDKTNALQQGDLTQLLITDLELSTFPRWKQGILKAWRKFGAYVEDTTGSHDWAIKWESGASYTSFCYSDPFVEVAKEFNIPYADYDGDGKIGYWFDIPSGVNWNNLRVIDQNRSR